MKKELKNIEEVIEEIRILDSSIEELIMSDLQINCEFNLHLILINIGYKVDKNNKVLLEKSLEFNNITFDDKVTIENINLRALKSNNTRYNKEFNICHCDIGGFICYHSTYNKHIEIKGSSFENIINFGWSDFNDTIYINSFNDINCSINISNSNINADIFIRAGNCKSFNASSTDFKGDLEFHGIEFKETVNFNRCIFRKKVWFDKIKFLSDTNFKQVEFKDRTYFTNICVGKNSNLYFSNAEVEKLFAYGINNDNSPNNLLGKIHFDGLKVMPNAVVRLRDIQAETGEINFCDAIIFGILDIKNVLVHKVDFEGTIFSGNLVENNFSAKGLNRDTYRLLKNEALKVNDTIKALEYHVKEMKEYQKENSIFTRIKWLQGTPIFLKKFFLYISKLKLYNSFLNNIPLFFNWISNNHGLSWFRGIVFTFAISILTALCILGSSELIVCDYTIKGFKFTWFLTIKIINITNWKDFPFKIIGWSYVWLFIGRIFIGYGYYQTAQAFRRFGKKNKLIIMNDLLEKELNRCINYTEVNLGYIPEVLEIKKKVSKLRDMRFIIYSNDHNPPHFHVKSRDGSINAKFTIAECEYISGEIKNKDIKRVKLFFKNVHENSKLKEEWNRRCNNL